MSLPGRRTRLAGLFLKGFVLILLTIFGFTSGLPINPAKAAASSTPNSATDSSSDTLYNGTVPIRAAGSDPVPNLSLPKALTSSVNGLVGAGGVIQGSSQNLTLYNSAISLRLLGTPIPHDLLLGQSGKVLSSYSFWSAQLLLNGSWVFLVPYSNSFMVLGTNKTGTFVVRTMNLTAGGYFGQLKITYKATSAGPLKWDLDFTPATSGQYRLLHSWADVTSYQLVTSVKQFRASFGDVNYTLAWNDVPASYETLASTTSNQFSLSINLGNLVAGSRTPVDPSLVSSSTSLYATAYSFQRKVFFEPKGGYYFVFYYNGSNTSYRSSHDGTNWSSDQQMPSLWPAFVDNATSLPAVYSSGQQVVIATGDKATTTTTASVRLRYWLGTIAGPTITWGSNYTAVTISRTSDSSSPITLGIRYVNLGASSKGMIVFSYNWYTYGSGSGHGIGTCNIGGDNSESGVYITYNATTLVSQCDWTSSGFRVDGEQDRSIVVPYGSNGRIRAVYQFHVGTTIELFAQWLDPNGSYGPLETVEGASVVDSDEFSAVADANFVTNLLYRNGRDFNITYAYSGLGSPPTNRWSYVKDIFGGNYNWPTITADYSTNNLYAFAANTGPGQVLMKIKPSTGSWKDSLLTSPISNIPAHGPNFLGSNLVSASSTNSTNILLVWTVFAGGGPFNIMFASIPVQTVWSPYSSPSDPWDGNGLAPYGQYFSNLGEYVSPSSGMLTVRQTDLSIPGRGLDLAITRVYTEPYKFLSGSPYGYESFPWAPLGNGWQLNFPWMTGGSPPSYVHLSDGQGYRMPSGFWSGFTATFENHQGEHFRLSRYVDGTIVLFTSSGLSYNFDSNHRLANITDTTGLNSIVFNYDANNHISKITDTIGRVFLFCYTSGLLHSINQTTSNNCTSSAGSVRGLVYNYNSHSDLLNATDPAGRTISYSYDSSYWLITRVTYPTSWYDTYAYSTFMSGTQAYIYRVNWEKVNASQGTPVRSFQYTYTSGNGDQVNNSTVATYDRAAPQPISFTSYAFSFAGVGWNVSDASHNLMRGDLQRFNVQGEIPKDTIIVYDRSGLNLSPGSYTSYYGYDLWGNQIYSRRAINPSSNSYHESFNAYYNNGEPPGFYAFQDSFSQKQGTASDNSWNVVNGYWMVNSGTYNGTPTTGPQEGVVAYSSLNKTDISIQARILLSNLVNKTADQRFGIFTHYAGGSLFRKWALTVRMLNGSPDLEFLDEWNQWLGHEGGQPSAMSSCSSWTISLISTSIWYTFNMTVHGTQAIGWVSAPGQPQCSVAGVFQSTSPALNGQGFGLYASTYSALFDDVQVATVSPFITGSGFSNSFIQNGPPGPIGLNTWLATTKPPGLGWNTSPSWNPYGWTQAYPSQNYGGNTWGMITGWPDSNAQWIWWDTNANVSAPNGPVWFRRVFSVSATTNLNIAMTSDDTFVAYVDGYKIGSGNNWQQIVSNSTTVIPGLHVFAVYATNLYGPDSAGLLVSAKNTGNGQVIFRSDATAGPNIVTTAGTAQLSGASPPTFTAGWNSARQNAGSGSTTQSVTVCNLSGGCKAGDTIVVNYWQCCSTGQSLSNVTDTQGNSYSEIALAKGANGNNVMADVWGAISILANTTSLTVTATYPDTSHYRAIFVQQYRNILAFGATHFTGQSSCTSTSESLTTTRTNSLVAISFDIGFMTGMSQTGGPSAANDFSYHSNAGWGLFLWDSTVPSIGSNTWSWNVSGCNSSYQSVAIELLGAQSIETYYGYAPWGGLTQSKHLYSSPSGPQWLTTSMTYDSYGNLATIVDARGNSTAYGYSSKYQNAYLTSMLQTLIPGPTQIISSFGYNLTMGTRIWSQEPDGYGTNRYNTTYRYDILGRLTKITYPTGDYASYGYNDKSNYVDVTNENGWHTRQVYDGLGRLSVDEKSLGASNYNQSYAYNWQNKIVTQTDQLGHVYTYQYDSLGRLTQTTEPNGNFTQVLYNDVRGWVRYVDESGYWRFSLYDRLGRLIESDDPTYLGVNSALYNYDEVGNLRNTCFANSQTNCQQPTIYSYDSLNRLTATKYADNTTELYTYDNTGNVLQKTDRKGVQTTLSYDSVNRIVSTTYHGAIVTTNTYIYDNNTNLVELDSSNATLFYAYDSRNRVTSECACSIVLSPYTSGYITSFTYTGETLSRITYYYDNLMINYTYDALGRVVGVFKSGSTASYATLNYYPTDQVKSISYGNGLWANYTYDSLSRPSTISLAGNGSHGQFQLLSLAYSYNKTGTVAQVNGQVNNVTLTEQYSYDPLRRLTNATLTNGSTQTTLSYQYDSLGNMLWQKQNVQTTTYSYNKANNELKSSSYGSTSTAYSYDPNGNLLTKNVTRTGTSHWTYTWDVPGNLVKVANDTGVQGSYVYDARGRLVGSKEASTTTFYAYLGTETLYQSIVGSSTTDYIFAAGMRIGKVTGSTVNYYHSDAEGSTRLVTGSSASVLFADDYQPFGLNNGTPTGSETYKFTGKPYSSTTGLYYYYQRWYDPSIGRFISMDVSSGDLSDSQSLNRYSYALNSPPTYVDPDGRSPVNEFLIEMSRGLISTVFPSRVIGTRVRFEGKWMSMKWGVPNLPDPIHSIFVIRDSSKASKATQYLKLDIESSGYQLVGWDSTAGKMAHGDFIDPRLGAGLETFGELAHFGKVLLPIGLAVSGYNIYNALSEDLSSGQGFRNTIVVGSQEGGGWVGAVIGAEAFGEAGAELGAVVGGPVGAAVGAAVGAVVGGILGSIYGQQVGGWVGNQLLLVGGNNAPGWIYYPTPMYGKGRANPI